MVLRKKMVVLWTFVVCVLLVAMTALFAENCWEIYWPLCDQVFNNGLQVDDECTDMCGRDSYFDSCEGDEGYTDWEVPFPVCSESGFWEFDQYYIMTVCAQKHQCYTSEFDCPDPPGTLYDYFLCAEGEPTGYEYTDVNFYGIDYSCGEE